MPEKNQRVPENCTSGRSTAAVDGASAGGGVIVGSEDGIPALSFILIYLETTKGGNVVSTSCCSFALCASRRITRCKEAIAHSIMLSSGSRVVKPCKASPGASSQRTTRKR